MGKSIKFKIIGNTYQSVNTVVNGKMFYTPKKGESITIECVELPTTLKKLRDNNVIIIKEII